MAEITVFKSRREALFLEFISLYKVSDQAFRVL